MEKATLTWKESVYACWMCPAFDLDPGHEGAHRFICLADGVERDGRGDGPVPDDCPARAPGGARFTHEVTAIDLGDDDAP